MGDAAQIELIRNLPAILAAIFSFVGLLIANRTKNIAQQTETNTNSMKDALVKVTGESEFARGKMEGHKQAKGDLDPDPR
jgi:hypothetical protein